MKKQSEIPMPSVYSGQEQPCIRQNNQLFDDTTRCKGWRHSIYTSDKKRELPVTPSAALVTLNRRMKAAKSKEVLGSNSRSSNNWWRPGGS